MSVAVPDAEIPDLLVLGAALVPGAVVPGAVVLVAALLLSGLGCAPFWRGSRRRRRRKEEEEEESVAADGRVRGILLSGGEQFAVFFVAAACRIGRHSTPFRCHLVSLFV